MPKLFTSKLFKPSTLMTHEFYNTPNRKPYIKSGVWTMIQRRRVNLFTTNLDVCLSTVPVVLNF